MHLPYCIDPLPLLEALRPLGRPVLLHSADQRHPAARHDILSAAPIRTLETRGGISILQRDGAVTESTRAPFELLEEMLASVTDAAGIVPAEASALAGDRAGLRADGAADGSASGSGGLLASGDDADDVGDDPGDVPFRGGLLGLAGYDLARASAGLGFEAPPAQLDTGFPDLVAGLYCWALVTDHHRRTTQLVSLPGHEVPDAALAAILGAVSAVRAGPVRPEAGAAFAFRPRLTAEVDRSSYGRAFERIQQYIRAGDCYQINLAIRFHGRTELDSTALYRALLAAHPAPFAGYLETPSGTVLSLSPERLLHCEAGAVSTSPIKGTRSRGSTPAEDEALRAELLASPKDRAENLMIVDLLRNDLGRSCEVGSIRVPKLFELQTFGSVHHLVSTIEGRLRADTTPLQALASAFPGGSITGAPKLRAMQIIDELEPARRGPYCGSLFRVDAQGRLDASITIRTLLQQGRDLWCWGGGGIVADSDADAEWREIHDKVRALVEGDASCGEAGLADRDRR